MQIKTIITAGVAAEMNASDEFNQFVIDSIYRHLSGDWGDASEHDRELNSSDPLNALSAYKSAAGVKIWIKQDGKILTVLFRMNIDQTGGGSAGERKII